MCTSANLLQLQLVDLGCKPPGLSLNLHSHGNQAGKLGHAIQDNLKLDLCMDCLCAHIATLQFITKDVDLGGKLVGLSLNLHSY